MYSYIKEYTSKKNDFMVTISSLKEGGVLYEIVNGQIKKPGVGLTNNEVTILIEKHDLDDYALIERTEY